jgi:2-succinyl-6-hydroxy-2,4-cyclohexadiene-1-carboxylate synthase
MVRRIVFAHGFTQTGRSWGCLIDALERELDGITAIAPDLPGHGDAAELRGDLWQSADVLASIGGHATYVGYSMGGRVALHTALRHPELVERLVLIGATAGIDDDRERAARRTSDNELADHIIRRSMPAFIDEWLGNPLFAGLTDDTAMRDDRLRNTATGLASSLRLAGTGTQEPLWDRLGNIRCPVLVLVGENDAKFTAIGHRLVEGLVDGRLVVVPRSGHTVHLEQPAATVDALTDFLR